MRRTGTYVHISALCLYTTFPSPYLTYTEKTQKLLSCYIYAQRYLLFLIF